MMTTANNENCPCGQPLHYRDAETQRIVEATVRKFGAYIPVTANGRTWLVSRHYIALHGIKASELPSLGFQEIGRGGEN
jgi:hypothetical protein